MSAGKYIEAYDDEMAREKLEELFKSKSMLELQETLTRVCNKYYEDNEKILDNDIVTKDTFHQNLTQLNGECLNTYIDERGNNPSALEGINYAFKFMVERSK